MIREAYHTSSDLCIIPIQDYLVKDNSARINHPSTTGTNWQWRMRPNELSKELSKSIFNMTKLYGRLPKKKEPEAEKTAEKEA